MSFIISKQFKEYSPAVGWQVDIYQPSSRLAGRVQPSSRLAGRYLSAPDANANLQIYFIPTLYRLSQQYGT